QRLRTRLRLPFARSPALLPVQRDRRVPQRRDPQAPRRRKLGIRLPPDRPPLRHPGPLPRMQPRPNPATTARCDPLRADWSESRAGLLSSPEGGTPTTRAGRSRLLVRLEGIGYAATTPFVVARSDPCGRLPLMSAFWVRSLAWSVVLIVVGVAAT